LTFRGICTFSFERYVRVMQTVDREKKTIANEFSFFLIKYSRISMLFYDKSMLEKVSQITFNSHSQYTKK